MGWRRAARWAGWIVLLFAIPQFIEDRLVEHHGESWWTHLVGGGPRMAGLMYLLHRWTNQTPQSEHEAIDDPT